MGREVRRVPADWHHPRDERGHYHPLHDLSYREAREAWDAQQAAWKRGERPPGFDPVRHGHLTFSQWHGDPPDPEDYRPDWPEATRTHLQMYETCTEGTPISPVLRTPEELARWLADTRASAFGDMTATYEQWLPVCLGEAAPSAVIQDGCLLSGVEAVGRPEQRGGA